MGHTITNINRWVFINQRFFSCFFFFSLIDYSASVGSEEESGKDWDELEEEARKGLYLVGVKGNYAGQSFYYLGIMSNSVDKVPVKNHKSKMDTSLLSLT